MNNPAHALIVVFGSACLILFAALVLGDGTAPILGQPMGVE